MINNLSILLIDDDSDILDALQEALEFEGYTVIPATEGRHALKLLTEMQAPALIIVDYLMPQMNGIEFLQHKSSLAHLAHVPVIFLTASSIKEGAFVGGNVELRNVQIMKKPVELELLLKQVSSLLKPDPQSSL
jgi:CheY-like chemotaxis protein